MTPKALSFILLTSIFLSACGALGAQASPTPPPATPTATRRAATATPTATEILITEEPPTPAATPTEAPPDNPADCTNSAAFVEDVTIPDESNISAGEGFVKTWRVRNTGTCTWWSGYYLTHYSEERMGAPDAVALKLTPPGGTLDISINLTAPTSIGAKRGNFVIKNPADLIMQVDNDSRLWVLINVQAAAATPTSTSTATGTPAEALSTATP